MTLKEALHNISASKYMRMTGYRYRDAHLFSDLKYEELNPALQAGILRLINNIYKTQKLVYFYELDFVVHMLKASGVRITPLMRAAGLDQRNKLLITEERLRDLRVELLRMITRLLRYTTGG